MTTSHFHPIRNLSIGLLLAASCTLIGSPRSLAQSQNDQSQSVAEAARKAKEQKKAAAKNNAVITDDTIHLRPASADSGAAPPSGTVVTTGSEAGPPPADNAAKNSAESTPAPTPAGQTTASADADPKKAGKLKSDIAKLKEMLAQVQPQLDLLKRQLALDSESFYSQPDYAHDTNGKAKLDDLQRQIGDKQVSVDELKQQLEQLLQQAGISADSDKPASPPQN